MWFIPVLLGSYLAKRKLVAQWERSEQTGKNDLTHESASSLIALSIPWDATVGLVFRDHNVLIGDPKDVEERRRKDVIAREQCDDRAR